MIANRKAEESKKVLAIVGFMKILQKLTRNISELKSNPKFKSVKKEKWYHFQRFYVIKSSDGNYGLISLNPIERLLQNICKVNYFEKAFEGKSITVINPNELNALEQRINERSRMVLTPSGMETNANQPKPPVTASETAPEPIRYKKGETKTQDILPRNKKKLLGTGSAGSVYEHKENSKLAIKKTNLREYEMGATLDHPVLAKTYRAYTKEYPENSGKPPVNRIVMDKIEGKIMANFTREENVISIEQAVKLLSQAKDCCSYLFDQNIVWYDIHDENSFIEDKTGNLKLIDFGSWRKVEDPNKKAMGLLNGARRLSVQVLRSIPQGKKSYHQGIDEKTNAFYQKISYPKKFFDESSIRKAENMSENELKNFILSYFDHVIAELEKPL